ncbi:MAG TPA: metallopeptidase TldD-related protein [Pyrinomonadaceae bacterium]|nr:metallopeptidase TldD-related protein [Pyrinomonadaceae bacterium]
MKRRDFMMKGSLAMAAVATSDLWLGRVVAGEEAKSLPILDTYFQVSKEEMQKLLAAALSKGADFADLFFEYRVTSNLTFEEDQVKNARRGIVSGVGIRAIRGDQVGYAFSEDLTMPSMLEAANSAAAIANDKTARVKVVGVTDLKPRNLYPILETVTSADLSKKLALIKEANEAAKAYSPKVARVQVYFGDEARYLAYANSEGKFWQDMQPYFTFTTGVLAEEGSNRQQSYETGGGRIGLEYFAKRRRPADIAKEAARMAVLNLGAQEADAGAQTVVLGAGDSAVLLHEAVGHGLEADFNWKKLSNFSGRVGQKVASDVCTVIDAGTFENLAGTINVDDEGNLPTSTTLIEAGTLRGYMADHISARQLGVKPTGNGRRQAYNFTPQARMTNTYMKPGTSDPEEIIRSVKRGVYAKKFSGGQVDITKGDFTFSVLESYLIEDGKITAPLKGVTLIGNGPEVMTKVTMVGNDLKFTDAGWTCGKSGQSVPVGMGIPTVKVSEITVGGTKVKKA